ncbi:PqqD family protein [Planktothrix sp. FACHB-1355]|uniref:PqqD family protein n=1 Tax=Aerosakkonema funiforme FACHB-1375 TaxID=2949571 RepID=A0A926VFL3_9CYAN|nr:PqqD family protein [Aerosakkonema funiforme FACHB-1375]MBD3561473.1 PqqD family protein [Planktothrix sp. FACHB-1355]
MKTSENFRINSPKVVHEMIDGEVVIVNLERGDYYSLVKAGAEIWEGLTKGISRVDIMENMVQRYDASRENIETAIDDLIEKLELEELIIIEKTDESIPLNTTNNQSETKANTEKLSFEIPTLQKYTDMEELLALDPIHEVDEMGWPNAKQDL